MKARCTKLIDTLGNPQTRSSWLTVGKIYHVLSVILDAQGRWTLRLLADSQPGVGLFPLEQFEIVSSKLSGRWIATWNNQGAFELTTEAWNEPGYWDRYFDSDSNAHATFDKEMAAIVASDP